MMTAITSVDVHVGEGEAEGVQRIKGLLEERKGQPISGEFCPWIEHRFIILLSTEPLAYFGSFHLLPASSGLWDGWATPVTITTFVCRPRPESVARF